MRLTPADLPALTREQIRETDRRAIEDYGIPGIVLMENAARNAANIIRTFPPAGASVAIVCGAGNNGGDGFAIARHLHNKNVPVTLFLAVPHDKLTGDAETNYKIARRIGLPIIPCATDADRPEAVAQLAEIPIIVDALLGTGFHGEVRAPLDKVIDMINHRDDATIVSIDVPSGLDCDSGAPSNATVRATETITMAARKIGFAQPNAAAWTGRVHVVDIGAPLSIVQDVLGGKSS